MVIRCQKGSNHLQLNNHDSKVEEKCQKDTNLLNGTLG